MRGLSIVLAFLFLFIQDGKGESCDNLGTLYYEELQCKPVTDKEGSCPKEYKCPEDYALSNKYCNFQGKQIKVDEPLGRSAGCNVGCFCSNNHGEEFASFTCAIVDCVENFGPPISSDCYRTHSLDSCCSIGEKCPTEDAPVPKCLVDGVTYNESQIFRPKNTCKACLCTKDFKEGVYEDDCQPRVCADEIRSSDKIAKKCAAVYYKKADDEALCCPQTWVCPDEAEDDINLSHDVDHSDLKCKYGDKTLNFKDSFKRKVNQYGRTRDLTCSCDLPPLVTCTGDY